MVTPSWCHLQPTPACISKFVHWQGISNFAHWQGELGQRGCAFSACWHAVQAAEGGPVHPAQLEEVPGPQGLSAVPPQSGEAAVCLA